MTPSSTTSDYPEFGYNDAEESPASRYLTPAVFDCLRGLPTGSRVLDVGSGNGALAGLLIADGFAVVGIDMSQQGVNIARAAHPNGRFEVLPADADLLERLGEPPFDAVVSTEVIEHLYDPASFLTGCRDALRPGSRFVISAPYHGYLKNLALSVAGSWDTHLQPGRVGGHIKFWSRRTLTEAISDAGFSEITFRGAGRLPFLWKSMILSAVRQR